MFRYDPPVSDADCHIDALLVGPFFSNFPAPSWYREKRTVTESDETALGSRASVQRFKSSAEEMGVVKRTGVDQNKGIWDLN